MGAGPKFDRQVIDDVPLLQIAGETLSIPPTIDRDKAALRVQNVFIDGEPAAGRKRRIGRRERCVGSHVLARPAVCADSEAAHRDSGDANCVRHLLVSQLEELGCRDRASEGDDLGSVDARSPAAPRLANPSGSLVADHDGTEQVSARCAGALRHRETSGREGRTFVSGVVDIAIIRRGGVTQHGVDAGGLMHRQLGPIEPNRRLRPAAMLLREPAEDGRRIDDRTGRGAGQRARENHLRMLTGERRQVVELRGIEQSRQRERLQ